MSDEVKYTEFQKLLLKLICEAPLKEFYSRAQVEFHEFLVMKAKEAQAGYEQRGYSKSELLVFEVVLKEFVQRVLGLPNLIRK